MSLSSVMEIATPTRQSEDIAVQEGISREVAKKIPGHKTDSAYREGHQGRGEEAHGVFEGAEMTTEEANGKLQSVKEAVGIGTTFRYYWFRGHTKPVGELLPSAHRERFFSARENIEFWAGQRFRLRAQAYSNKVPAWDDHVSWLFLAQHYGVPTRLLDWTENVLVGLYFAVTGGDEKEDGELWCMDPDKLNWHSADCHICFPDSGLVRLLAAPVFLEPDKLADFTVKLNSPTINGPLALIPPMQFPRMAAQMSRFTIHWSRKPEEQIKFLLRGSELLRYIIPAEFKTSLARDLYRLGFTHENLYRDLDSLACTIKKEILEPDYEIKDRASEEEA